MRRLIARAGFHIAQIADHRLQRAIKQATFIEHDQIATHIGAQQTIAVIFRNLHPGAINENVFAGGANNRRETAAQHGSTTLLELDPVTHLQTIHSLGGTFFA